MSETQSFKSLTVIIPTYNRKDLLAKALAGYLAQSSPQLIHELLIVDDGSTDSTESKVREISGRAPFPVRYLRQANQGPAAARNLGIREARSNLLLFTDSDIIPTRDLVEHHMEWHRRNPQINTAVLGYVTWSPDLNATPFMRWYGEFGLFGYGHLRKRKKVTFHFFYTCNLSLKTDFLRTCGQFDEDFKGAAFEDIELACRLTKHGLQIVYNPGAVAYHHQFFSFQAACQKERGKLPAAQLLSKKEAGKQIAEERIRGKSRRGYAIAKRAKKEIATTLARTLAPARHLLDCRIPLPSFVYKLFLWYDVNHSISNL